MKISIVTDEISADLETAIELGVEWGVRNFELRGFDAQRVPLFSEFQKQRVRELVEEYDAQIVAISPGLFKFPFPLRKRERFPLRTFDVSLYQRWRESHDLLKYQLTELLPASIDYAREVGADKIVIFGFHRGSNRAGPAPDEVLATLQQAAQEAAKAHLQLCIEVEDEFWADTGQRTAELVEAVGHPALSVNWDPGNALVAGDVPYPDGYQAVRHHVRHVHFKDVKYLGERDYRFVVNGDIDWAAQIKALIADGYTGCISVETHMEPKVSSARLVLQRLKQLLETVSTDTKGEQT